ncbi:MAG: TerD family protein, partial [Muribaculaceae bacterium]|nr:TerD family protein [Muribaculaceae bacterium]
DLSHIDPRATEIRFVVTIHKADERRQNFGQVRNAFIRIYNSVTGEEILRYDLDEDFSIETAVEFGRLYKRNGQWKFEAIGTGQKAGLAQYLNKYN